MAKESRDTEGPNAAGTEQGKPNARKPLTEFELSRVAAVFELLGQWDKAAKGKGLPEQPASLPLPTTDDDWKPCRRVAFE